MAAIVPVSAPNYINFCAVQATAKTPTLGGMSLLERNRLAQTTSPYLQQHARNPVHWQPWDQVTLEAARELHRPILLSIGYSSCHWCHLMAHESFEDAATAELMNSRFVNIKVDREERPDLDKIYQHAHFLLTQQSGGWPLTIFLSPVDHSPFFSGTYFPPRARHGLPAFKDLLRGVAQAWEEQQEAICAQSNSLQLAHLVQEPRYRIAAENTLKAAWNGLQQTPHAHASLLLALDQFINPRDSLLIWSTREQQPQWRQQAHQYLHSFNCDTWFITSANADLPTALLAPGREMGCARLCQDNHCLPLILVPNDLP